MLIDQFDIRVFSTQAEGLPKPRWDEINTWVENNVQRDDCLNAWTTIVHRWLNDLADALGGHYVTSESDNFLLLGSQDLPPPTLLAVAESYLRHLHDTLPEVADFETFGKHALIILDTNETYYRYLSLFYPEGRHGGSSGVHVREGYPHIALCNFDKGELRKSLAHELTHHALLHRALPLWIEEGFTQLFEHELSGRQLLQVDRRISNRHKRCWRRLGLGVFWNGEGFSHSGSVSELCYQLAEILMRLLIEDHRPRWFGLSRGRHEQFLAFVRDANFEDCGERAAREHLGYGLKELAAKFLGPGEWNPPDET